MQGKPLKSSKTLARYSEDHSMYRPESKQVSVFENESFFQFQGLNPDNDWVRLAKLIPFSAHQALTVMPPPEICA
jgi:hypothetical protein